jgi:hypothetical protein
MRKMSARCIGGWLAVLSVGALSTVTEAAVIFADDFESYADTTALNAVWTRGAGTDTDTYLSVGPAGSTNTSDTVRHDNRIGRRDRNFAPALPTADAPVVVEFDFYDDNAEVGIGDNAYNQLLAFSGTTLTQLVAMGKSNLTATDDPTKYQARVAFNSSNWLTLNATRSVGWHTFRAEIFSNEVDFYVDGVADVQNVAITGSTFGDGFSQARIGTGLSSRAEVSYYDNYSVSVVPEPASLAALSVAGLALMRRRRT